MQQQNLPEGQNGPLEMLLTTPSSSSGHTSLSDPIRLVCRPRKIRKEAEVAPPNTERLQSAVVRATSFWKVGELSVKVVSFSPRIPPDPSKTIRHPSPLGRPHIPPLSIECQIRYRLPSAATKG